MKLEDLAVLSSSNISIDNIFRLSAKRAPYVKHPGLVILLDDKKKLVGVVTDGDFRKAYSNNIDFKMPVSEIMTRDPITMPDYLNKKELIKEINERSNSSSQTNGWLRNILIIDKNRKVINIVDFFELVKDFENPQRKIKIFGMGFVGLTLGVSLASKGHKVVGVDINLNLIKDLNASLSNIYEPGLNQTLHNCLRNNRIFFTNNISKGESEVYIIAVGTPLNSSGKPELNQLKEAVDAIANVIKKDDLVLLRSTVPVGTTRNIVIPMIENISKLKAGEDFCIAFTPERTVEGNALKELRSLPQIIGGYTKKCSRQASSFWSSLSGSLVQVASLESAEIVKLANNTFRDLSFAFANQIALMSDKYNINAFELIGAANDGYPRNKIPFPSPGVGGYCLTKDPYLFGFDSSGKSLPNNLGIVGRDINNNAGLYPIKVLEKYSKLIKCSFKDFDVLIIGMAFKGIPDTTDLRGSVSVEIFNNLKDKVNSLSSWDAVVSYSSLKENNLNPISDLKIDINKFNVILILNNHSKNINFNPFIKVKSKRLIFDGWHMLDSSEVEKVVGQTYSTMGYMTKI